MSAVECRDLCFQYGETDVLRDVNFTIQTGESIGVIGPNGGGKTTLLNLIAGFLQPSSGTISVFGLDPEEAQSEIAYVPQHMRYDRHFPISTLELVLGGRLSQLPWYGRFKDEDREKAQQALQKVGLSDLAARSFSSLSGGQQQRVLIARALASEPKLLLLDEPTASVDPDAEAAIVSVLQSMRGTLTLMTVTHDLQSAIHDFDRVLCVQNQVIAYSPQEVCEHYALGLYHPPLINLPTNQHE